jgi:EmrB/QacA subfamily drug resistance transporter
MSDRSPSGRLDPELRKTMGITFIGLIAVYLDATIVNVAINTLSRELHATVNTIQWVSTAYLLALGMVVPLSGWLVSRFGAKRMWMFSLAVFLLGSVLSGAAWSIGSLIAFRVLQGVGGGLMTPILQTLIVQAAGREQIGRVIATLGLPAVAVPILGPAVGGLILTNASWRWIFFINVPLCLVGLVLAWRGLADTPPAGRRGLDVVGLVLLPPALAAILYGLSRVGGPGGFGQPMVIVLMVIGLVLLALFAVHAVRTAEPLVDVHLFRFRSFAVSCGLLFLMGLSLYGAMLLLPLYYQQAQRHTAVIAGLLLIPQGIGSLIARGWVAGLIDRVGARPMALVGTVLAAIGLVSYTQVGIHHNAILLGVSLVFVGTGISTGVTAVTAGAYQGLGRSDIPHATSASRIVQQVGYSFGTAVLAVILQRQVAVHAGTGDAGLSAAFGDTFWWLLGFLVVAFLGCLLLPGPQRAPATPPTSPEEAKSSR